MALRLGVGCALARPAPFAGLEGGFFWCRVGANNLIHVNKVPQQANTGLPAEFFS